MSAATWAEGDQEGGHASHLRPVHATGTWCSGEAKLAVSWPCGKFGDRGILWPGRKRKGSAVGKYLMIPIAIKRKGETRCSDARK